MKLYKTVPTVLPFDNTKPLMFDTETMHGFGGRTRLVQLHQAGVTVLLDCYYISVEDIKPLLQPFTLVAHNIMYDLSCVDFAGWLPTEIHDTMHLAKCYMPKLESFSLASVANHYGLVKGDEGKSDWSQPLTAEQLDYAAYDVIMLQRIWDELSPQIDINYKIDMLSLRYALRYQLNGVPVHRKNLMKKRRELNTKMKKINAQLPQDLNVNSPKQLSEYFKTDNANKDTMTSLALDGNKMAQVVLDAKKYTKQLNFIEKFDAPRIFGYLHPSMAKSGRFTCKGMEGANPRSQNIQQIPRELKSVFGFEDGRYFVDCDYGAIEMVTAAAMIGDPKLCEFILEGKDLHTETARMIYDKEDITKSERQIAKSANFGLLYAGGAGMYQAYVRQTAGIILTIEEATTIRNKWLSIYSGIKAWHQRVIRSTTFKDYTIVDTVMGRRMRANTLNEACNLPIQGSASEAMKLAIHHLYKALPEARIVNVVHDQIVLECMSREEAEHQAPILEAAMIKGWTIINKQMMVQLPIKAEAEIVKVLG